jgi:hypothetical protein
VQRPISRKKSAFAGAALGLMVGNLWTAIMAVLADRWMEVVTFFIIFASGLTIAGLAVGITREWPEAVGATFSVMLLLALCLVWQAVEWARQGSIDMWIAMWLVVFAGSGIICGPVIGALFRLIRNSSLLR